MLKTHIGRLRWIGLVEGTSYVYLVFVAMPQKYIMGIEEAVSWPGRIHGGLFCVFCLALFLAWKPAQWSVHTCAKIMIAALIPFGTYVIDPWLRREDRRVSGDPGPPDSSNA